MPLFTDQLGNQVSVPSRPQRIVSLVPSQTELLYELGLNERVAAITKFCIHPDAWFRTKVRIGGTKNPDISRIRELRPDLVLANKEENGKETVELLALEFPVWTSDISTLEDALAMIAAVGDMTGTTPRAAELVVAIQNNFVDLAHAKSRRRTCYLIWKDPWMTIGGDTFIHDMLERAGFDNMFAASRRYPETSVSFLRENHCELLLLSSEPYPFRGKHVQELKKELPGTQVLCVDGEYFSWYGSRLVHAPAYFAKLQEEIQALSVF
ncbi:MAG TPA: helical backbone metal receptor [Flavisolibacter sp.]